jgi:CheY-like chemotaxis protein
MEKNILVVDDEGLITKTVGNLLKREGYTVEVAEDGLQAQEKVKKADFNLIIADIRMPEMDGLETVIRIKKFLKENKKPDIPVIFITGYADSDSHIKAGKIGKVIFKPFDIKEFLSEVTRSLGKK